MAILQTAERSSHLDPSENVIYQRHLIAYKEAAKLRLNNFSTPTYLYKAGITALDLGKGKEALDLFKQLKDN